MAQRPDDVFHPFSANDIYRALRWFVPHSKADLVARVMSGELRDEPDVTGTGVSGGFMSDDLLIVMSLQSDELREKVDRFRRENDRRYDKPEEQARWEVRREEIRKAIESGAIKPPE
ncbi:MAG: hypothetical protein ABR499_05750 [Gemmatimonadaceae bacterium]